MADVTIPTANIVYAILGGIIPALIWLWFWLQEDRVHPEPRMRIIMSFIGGMIAVVLVYPLQKMAFEYFGGINTQTLFVWALIEEMMKYLMVAIIALHGPDFDEPLDAMEYLIITALGFAALENTLYILNPVLLGHSLQGLIDGNWRFIGASLLHVVASALVGFCLAQAFYMSKVKRMGWRVLGLSLAIALHTLFNVFIIKAQENESMKLIVFSFIWFMVLIVLLLFEKIKKVKAQS